MSRYAYPLQLTFKVVTLSNDFIAQDASGAQIFYAREKILSWRDRIKIYSDTRKSDLLYEITSNRRIDFQQTFTITDRDQRILGSLRRKTLKSLWRKTFKCTDAEGHEDYLIRENSVLVSFMDSLLGDIPLLGLLSAYVFQPVYTLQDKSGKGWLQLRKEPSFWGRKFTITPLVEVLPAEQEDRLVLSLMTFVLQEREHS